MNEAMIAAARSVARHFELSGFYGFDFVLDEISGEPKLIEINPRATQINHFACGAGHDLPGALRGVRTSGPMAPEIDMTKQRPAQCIFSAEVQKRLSEIRRDEALAAQQKASTAA